MFSKHFLNRIKQAWEYDRMLVVNRAGAHFCDVKDSSSIESVELEWLEDEVGLKAAVNALVAARFTLKIGYTGIENSEWSVELQPPTISRCCGDLHDAVDGAVIEAHR